MILGAFGDSFLFGNDLKDCIGNTASSCTWPALISKKLNMQYKCHAKPGIGNRQIINSLLDTIGNYDFYIINWTWIDRYDYVDIVSNTWNTTRPVLDNKKIDKFYYKHLHSELHDKQNTLGIVYQAISLLEAHNCKYLMTYMDSLILDEKWHCPPNVKLLQEKVKNKLDSIEGMTFLDYARTNNLPISDRWHPLEDAHQAAAEYWLPKVHTLLNTNAKEEKP